ncbi:urease accessory protein UreF [Nonomuraea africana]|uniref:urease accessory protein UreF n=1 Tax=Nonomuraea africana TaxID=46171 RepID=UPI0033D04218
MSAATLLLLADSRLPAGGHAHSGGAEQAVRTGAVHDLTSLRAFLSGRLHTAGLVAAGLAAAACRTAQLPAASPEEPQPASSGVGSRPTTTSAGETEPSGAPSAPMTWPDLDAEADALSASPAQREANRQQGRLLLRVARRVWPSPVLEELARAVPNPHHPVALGAVAHAAGATPAEAALAAAYHAVAGPATAAVRLLGLDPVEVHRLLADLAPDLEAVAGRAAAADRPPATSAPALDLLAERHTRADLRLFVS